MSYDHEANAAEAATLLEELKRLANPERMSSLARMRGDDAATAAMSMEKAVGIHVFQDAGGGWLVDLVFRDMPPGVSNIIATPRTNPHFTRDKAMEAAVRLVEIVMAVDRDRIRYPNGVVTFNFHGVGFSFGKEQIDWLRRTFTDPPNEEQIFAMLNLMTVKLYEEVGEMKPSKASKELGRDLNRIVAMALVLDIDKWPRDEPEPRGPGH